MSFSMEPWKGDEYFDLNSPDLEIFSTGLPKQAAKKTTNLLLILDKTSVKATLTFFLLFSLFVSTFIIASRIQKPTFNTSSANVGYVPEAQIDLPKTSLIKSCFEVIHNSNEPAFLQSYCQGETCVYEESREGCESVDVVVIENGNLRQDSGQDGVSDCVWFEEETSCKPKY